MTADPGLTITMAKRIELWPVDRLRPYERNARTHSAEQVAQIAASIVEFGFTNPILVDSNDGIIAGHGRLTAAQELGLRTVPVVVLDHLSDRQRKAYIIADNQLAFNAGWDTDLLRGELQDLAELDFDLSLIGFSDDELADLLPDIEELPPEDADADAVPEPQADPITKPGDVWLLGKHRVMCGDSTSVDAVEALMEGVKADCVWTDPPYGVAYVGGVSHDPKYAKKRETKGLTIENDALNDDELTDFLRASLGAAFAACKDGAAWYVAAPAGPLFHCFGTVLKDFGVWRHTLAWVKSAFVFGRSDYHYQHEAIFYGWKPGAAHKWTGDRKQSSTLNFDRPKGSENPGHPTPKPVELVEYCLGNSSGRGDVVLEPFGGSGSTLIACEKTGRQARLMELDPRYCDVIVKRWQQFTGKTAKLEATGEPFPADA